MVTMTQTPTLSIVTPVLNGEAFVGKALHSVAEASALGADIEHIIVDGGSTDRTLELVREAQSEYGSPITQVVTGADSGQSQAINRGIAMARGRYVGWLNADDFYVPVGLARFVRVASESSADVVVGRCRFVDAGGRTVFEVRPPDPVTPSALLRLLSGWFAGRSIVQPEAFIAREAFGRVGGIDESLHYTMDYHLWLRLAISGASFELTDIDVARQLVHPGQKTADNAAVADEMLTYATEMVGCVEPSSDREAVKREMERVASRLRCARRIFAGLDRLSELSQAGLVAFANDARMSEPQLQMIHAGISARSRVLLAGLCAEDAERLVQSLRLRAAPVVAGRVPTVHAAFDVIVASGRAAAGLSQGFRITDALRPDGKVYLTDVVGGKILASRATSLRKAISDSVTIKSHVLLDTHEAASLAECMRAMLRNAARIDLSADSRVDVLDAAGELRCGAALFGPIGLACVRRH